MRGVSLDEISVATRIATRFLQAIENERWEQLPGGIFNRGFVRAMAHYLGLDEESIIAEYVLAVGDRPSVPVWTGSPPAVTPDHRWVAWIIAAAAIVVFIVGGWLAAWRISARRTARRARNAAVTAVPVPVSTAPQPGNEVPSANAAGADSAAIVPGAPTVASASTAPGRGTESVDPALLVLKIEAGRSTRVTVESDARRVFAKIIKSGESRTFTAQDKFQVSARDGAALLLELNGKTLPPIGPPGQAGKITLTREALKGATGEAH